MDDSREAAECRIELNPFYKWIGDTQQYLRSVKAQIHPAVFTAAMGIIHTLAEMHATDRPDLCPDEEGGICFCWHHDKTSPLYGMEVRVEAPFEKGDRFVEFRPWKVGQAPVHPPGVWNEEGK